MGRCRHMETLDIGCGAMKANRCVSFWASGFLTVVIILTAGCSTTHEKTIPKPSHAAAAANDFPTAIQAGIPSTTFK